MHTAALTTALPAALFAGLVAILVTLAVERFGGRVGGILGTLPTTIVPAALGIALSAETSAFEAAMFAVPPSMLINSLFLAIWRVLPARLPSSSLYVRLAIMCAASLGCWAVLAIALVVTLRREGSLAVALVSIAIMLGLGLFMTRTATAAPRGTRRVPKWMWLARGGFAAGAIFVAVLVAPTSEIVAGVAACFPAIFLTTMVGLWLAQDEAVPAGAVGPMMLGSSSVAWFAVFAALLFPALGVPLGALAAWGAAVVVGAGPAVLWLRSRT